ncbi:MAG: hypothetical protein Q7U57_05490 [Methylovulum sp.]|nr:hypothetical protein [Methylovulum sp.]
MSQEKPKTYKAEFKASSVKLANESDQPIAQRWTVADSNRTGEFVCQSSIVQRTKFSYTFVLNLVRWTIPDIEKNRVQDIVFRIVDTFNADLHILATKIEGLAQKFGILAIKPVSLIKAFAIVV